MSMKKLRVAGTPEVTTTSDGRLAVSVPIRIKRRGSRKAVALPGTEASQTRPTVLQLALARGHRWLALLESGQVQSLKEIAKREGVRSSYVSRMVNLTLLAPDIVATILDDALPDEVKLLELAVDVPALWEAQRSREPPRVQPSPSARSPSA